MTAFEVRPDEMGQKAKSHAEVSTAIAALMTWFVSELDRVGDPFVGTDEATRTYAEKYHPQMAEVIRQVSEAARSVEGFADTLSTHAQNYRANENELHQELKSIERPDVVA